MRPVLIGVVAFGLLSVVAIPSYLIQTHLENVTIKVVSKERLAQVSGSDGNTNTKFVNYVYTGDETYVVKDSFWNWHFRARTIYAKIPSDPSTCTVTLSGYRWGFLSMHQNIITADCHPRKDTR